MRRLLGAVLLVLALGASGAVSAQELGKGKLPITLIPEPPANLLNGGTIEISGVVRGSAATVVLRIDDKWGASYAERFNGERTFAPGPFKWSISVAQIKASNGQPLNLASIRQMVLFVSSGGAVEVDTFRTSASPGSLDPAPAAVPRTEAKLAPALVDLGKGRLPITYIPDPPASLSPDGAIEIAGVVRGGPTTIVLRVDDKWGASYEERFNGERTFPPGPFRWSVPIKDIKATNGQALNLGSIRQMVLFVTSSASVEISTFRATASPAAPTSTQPAPAQVELPSAPASLILGKGKLPITLSPEPPARLSSYASIEIIGVVHNRPASVVLRVDDKWGASYAERFNGERTFPLGPFNWTVPVSDIKASNGQPLNLAAVRQIVLFVSSGGAVEVTSFRAHNEGQTAVSGHAAAATGEGASATVSMGTGRAPIRYEPSNGINGAGKQLIVEGTIEGNATQPVVIRLDDPQSSDYPSRVSIDRTLPPGPFRFQIGIDGLRTPNGRTIDPRNIRRIIFGPYPESRNVVVSRFDLADIIGLPDGAKGYALGSPEATLPAGFERIAPGDRRLNGPAIGVRRRPKPDPLVANGLRGLSRIRLAAEPGPARVTIWSEDPGEWEFVPQVLRRSIKVNGVVALQESLSPATWLSRRYLRGRWQEHDLAADTWTAFGIHRGDKRTVQVNVGADGLVIEIDGDSADERFVSAVLVERGGSSRALEQVERERADWYRSNWRVASPADLKLGWPENGLPEVTAVDLDKDAAGGNAGSLRAKAAPGTGVRLVVEATSSVVIAKPVVRLTDPRHSDAGMSLQTRIWGGLWKLTHRDMSLSLLTRWDDQLMSDVSRLDIKASTPEARQPRRYEIWVDVPPRTAPGRYNGKLEIGEGSRISTVPIEIDVLRSRLPPVRKPVGFYLNHTPHLAWRGSTRLDRERQSKCDLELLARFGLTGTSPPVTAPLRDGFDTFVGEMQAALTTGVAPGWLLYDPLKDLREAYGDERAARIGAAAIETLKRRNLPLPVFTAADEPSNPEQFTKGLQPWLAALRRFAPEMKIAGHLNSPSDMPVVRLFDVAIVNPSFGLDLATIDRIAGSGRSVWIYNTFEPRLTGGFWLTYSKAERYLQWHARMPTADAFDPLDGRELDVQAIYPGEAICDPKPDIHRDLLRLAEGVVDQRWLLWLEGRSERTAKQLAQNLRSRMGNTWAGALRFTDADLSRIRTEIITLAESLEK